MIRVILFKKPDCNVCVKLEESLRNYIQKHGDTSQFEFEQVYIDNPEGLARYAYADFGKIPGALFLPEGIEEGSDHFLMKWNGEADWRQLRRILEEVMPAPVETVEVEGICQLTA